MHFPTKGKNFSANNVTGKRKESDFYPTPYCLTRLLLQRIRLRGPRIFEPACGNGAITHVLDEFVYNYYYSDLSTGIDFLKESRHFDTIITNPPYSLSDEFIAKAKELSDNFYFLLPLSYLHGKARYDNVYCDAAYPLKTVYIFTRYPMFESELRADGKHRTGMMVFAWFHFERQPPGVAVTPPTIEWLDNHPYVIGARIAK